MNYVSVHNTNSFINDRILHVISLLVWTVFEYRDHYIWSLSLEQEAMLYRTL